MYLNYIFKHSSTEALLQQTAASFRYFVIDIFVNILMYPDPANLL